MLTPTPLDESEEGLKGEGGFTRKIEIFQNHTTHGYVKYSRILLGVIGKMEINTVKQCSTVTKETHRYMYFLRKQLHHLIKLLILFQCIIDRISANDRHKKITKAHATVGGYSS